MYLKRLEMQGFKSFADKTVLEFMPGITSVIGPNGSGKSNISDAIRWVLGEQSMKSLRGSKSEDIIFAGTQNRKSLGFAEASLIFDNTDGKLPVEYTEVTVTRKIYRSGESGYYINKTPCRLKDVLELFMDTGIGKDGYSIIGQGKIDEILSNKSEDRRHIFEEAAGIVKYRVRKAESEKKLEHTKLNLLRINDILSEIESNIEPLKLQSEKAKKFLNLREELKSIEVGLFLYNIDTYKEKLQKVIEDEEILKSQNDEANSKMQEISELKENLKQEIDRLQEKEEELEKLVNKLSAKELEIEEKKKKVEENIDSKYEKQVNISTIEANLENIEKRKKQISSEIDFNISELDSTRLTKQEIAKTFYEIEANRNEAVKSLERISAQKEETEKKEKEYEEKINSLYSEYRIKESRLKFLKETEREKEGYIRSVKNLLLDCEKDIGLKKGTHGVLASIIKTPKEYETAIEMTLGAATQNIVTETEQDAKKLVEHLRKNNLGRASFLPIASVKGKKLEKYNSKGITGIIGIASDLVQFNKKYEQIVLSLLGRTVVVENMDTAIALAKQNNYSFRIVTQKGDLINPSGAITGGSVAQKTVNILGRGREIEELEKELKKIKSKIERTEQEKEEYLQSSENVMEEIMSLEKSLQEIDIVYASDKQKVIAVDENIERLTKRLEKLKEELKELEEQKENNINQKEQEEKDIKTIIEENVELTAIIEQFANLNKDNQAYIDNLNMDVTNLKISVSSFDESETSINEMVERIEQDVQNNINSIENKQKQKQIIENDNKELEEKITTLLEKIDQINEQVSKSGDKVIDLKEERTNKNNDLSKAEKDYEAQFEVIEALKEQIVKIDVKKTKLEQDIETVVNKLWEEYELTPNNVTEYEKPQNVQTTTKQVNSLRNQIKDLGSINIDSIEEYNTTKQRYDFMCEQRLDLEDGIAKLKKVIQDMTSIMKTQFATQFEIINKNFGEVFKELFGGGKAELILTDAENILECGIDIHVQPPGKKLQNMSLLSGGEKAFTAIALLFAILKINPSPFCVLDEIEAALDDVNVYRYADYLKKFINNTQFLVITHRKGTMEAADTVYGITMEENGISKLLSMKLK